MHKNNCEKNLRYANMQNFYSIEDHKNLVKLIISEDQSLFELFSPSDS